MIQNFVIPGFVAPAVLPIKVGDTGGVYGMMADVSVDPKSALWGAFSQYPASFPPNTDSYVVLKGAVGNFPAAVAFACSGTWQKAIVLQNRVILVPVNFPEAVTDYAIDITDGVVSNQILVTAQDTTPSVGAFSVVATWKNTLYSKGGQKVAVEGTGLYGVAEITDSEGHVLSFKKVSDAWLVLEMAAIAAPGVITLTFKNGAGTILGTTLVTVNAGNEMAGEVFFSNTGDIVSVWVDREGVAVYASYGGSIYPGLMPAQDDLFGRLNEWEANFVRVVRDKLGKVLAYCPYSIMAVDGSVYFTGVADENGVISIVRSALPSRFIIQYDSVMVPVRREWITL